jgi:hypothetical protein
MSLIDSLQAAIDDADRDRFTPGPWEVNPEDTDQVWGTGENAVRLAQAIHWPKHNAAANARLIAKAPDMMMALVAIIRRGNLSPEMQAMAREVVTAALGHPIPKA